MAAVGASLPVINAALAFLGERPLASETDDVPAADVVRAQWAFVRRAELAGHPWQFATRRTTLGAAAEAPVFGWARAFPLPADYLRLLELPDLGWQWVRPIGEAPMQVAGSPAFELEGNQVLCNAEAPLRCRYVFDQADHAKWHPLFAEAMAYRFAVILAELVTQSGSRREAAMIEHDRTIARARRVSAIEKPPRRLVDASPWLDGRHGSYFG